MIIFCSQFRKHELISFLKYILNFSFIMIFFSEKHIMVVHEGIKPYLCDICGYGTNLRVKMELHMATKHNEDKVLSYVCDVCDYKCSNQLHLRAHLQIVHLENLTPFECGVCQYQCRKRASVVKHMKIVHEKRRPFQCTQCDKAFPVNSVLLRHIESVHDKVNIRYLKS